MEHERLVTRESPYAVHLMAIGLVLFSVLCLKIFFFPIHPVNPPPLQSKVQDEQAPQVLIIGPVGSGKTKLWSELVSGPEQQIQTWTSTGESRATVDLHPPAVAPDGKTRDPLPAPLVLLNTPGHPSLRCPSLARNLPGAAALVFVIDSQFGLSGQGLRDTSEALQLVLSFLQLLAYQRPNSAVPKLSIHLSNTSQKPVPEAPPTDVVVQKTRATLTKELNRRRIGSTAASDASPTFGEDQPESPETVPSTGLSRSLGFLARLLPFALASVAARGQHGRKVELPRDEPELLRLLDQEEDLTIGADRNLSALDRYEKVSGNQVHWSIEGQEALVDGHQTDHPLLQWLREL